MNNKLEMMENKLAELEALVEKKSGNKNPDYYKTQREYKLFQYLYLSERGEGIPQDMEEWFISYLKGVQRTAVIVQEGDALMSLLKKYEETKDIYNKIMKAAEKEGLILNAEGAFVRR